MVRPDASLLALSAEEAAWLDRHGYPSVAELAAVDTYDAEALDNAARNRGDAKSAALLGHRLLNEGDVDDALAAFSKGAKLGSLYAMQQHAILSAQRSAQVSAADLATADQGTLGVLISRLEMARLLGDHRAKSLVDQYGRNFHWDQYGKDVLAQVATFMHQYGEYAAARGQQAPGPDPRPNAAAWAELQRDPDARVQVYTRGETG